MKFDDLYSIIEEGSYPQQKASDKELIKFLQKRKDGASRIHTQSSRKSGPARLTAKHFQVKLPIYDRVIKMIKNGDKLLVLKKEYNATLAELRKTRQPMKFQELTGKLEVLGEVLIKTGNM